MHYRYPPLFLLLFTPLALLPLGLSAATWLVLKVGVLVSLIRAFNARLKPMAGKIGWIIPLFLAGPYVVEDLRYGNAQLFVFALTAFSLMLVREKPLLSSLTLALGIAVKVWPLFFIPYLLVRRETKVVVWTLCIVLVLTAIPSLYFGVDGNLRLLGQWFSQEFATQSGSQEIWFPSQSLRGMLMRYLTVVDYSQVPDGNYRPVHLVSWSPDIVRMIWLCSAIVVYVAFLWWTASRWKDDGWVDHGLAFCLVALLQPFTQKYALVMLLWPAIVVGRYVWQSARTVVYLSIAMVLIQPVVPGSDAQRLLQVLGLDFAATLTLAVALAWMVKAEPAVTTFSSLRNTSFNS